MMAGRALVPLLVAACTASPSGALRDRTYRIHAPAASGPRPALLVFHGAGGDGAGMEAGVGLDAFADQMGFVAVYPDAVAGDARRTWALGCAQCTWADVAGVDDYAFVRDLVDALGDRIDRRRVYVAGVSLGGSFAYDVACHEPDLVAGAAVVASLPSVEELALCRPATRAQRILTNIGDRDPNVPWDGGAGGSGANYQGAVATAAGWAARDGCAGAAAERDLPDVDGDGQRVHVLEYTDCPAGGLVRFFEVGGAGHEWTRSPDFDVSAELARTFFQ